MTLPPLIAHVVHRFDYGGLENGIVNLINGLPPSAYRHAIICLHGYSDFVHRITRDVEIVSIEKKAGKDLPAYSRMWRVLKRLKPTVVHTRNFGTLDCSFVAASAGVPVRIHGLHGWDVSDLHGESKKYRLLYRACNLSIDRYVAVSRHLAQWIERKVGVAPAKVRQIYNGVDTERFAPGRHAASVLPPEFEGTTGARPVIFCSVGRLAAVKNQELLVRAFAILAQRVPRARDRLRLAVIGDGPLRARLTDLAREVGVTELCWFAGARDDVAAILSAIDVFVLPSLNEGISNTLLEAMSAGRPVVATDVGGNRELVEHAQTGYLVPPGDPDTLASTLQLYCSEPGLIREHGERARRRACDCFSIARMLDDYQRLYDEAVQLVA